MMYNVSWNSFDTKTAIIAIMLVLSLMTVHQCGGESEYSMDSSTADRAEQLFK